MKGEQTGENNHRAVQEHIGKAAKFLSKYNFAKHSFEQPVGPVLNKSSRLNHD